jgi:hypothetical protein
LALYSNTTTSGENTIPDPLISQRHSYRVFYNTGDYLEYKKNIDNSNDEILVNVINDGGIQDSTIPIKTYLQMIHIEFYSPEKFREDLEQVFFGLCIDLKSKLDTIDQTAVQLSTDSQPTFNEKESLGIDVFTGYFDLSCIIYADAHISNSYNLVINGVSVPFSSLDISRGYETTPDLQKRASVKYFQNTSVFSLDIKALYSKSTLIDALFSDTTSGTTINSIYSITLYDTTTATASNPNGTQKFTTDLYLQKCHFSFAYGSIVGWDASFVPALSNI